MPRTGLASGVSIAAIAIAAATATAHRAGRADVYCGRDRHSARWSVRTLTDLGAARIVWAPGVATVGQLRALARPRLITRATPRLRVERRVFRVPAVMLRFQLQANNDYRLVLADPEARAKTVLAAIPSPDCTVGAQHRFAMTRARYAFQRRCLNVRQPVPVKVTGLVSFDPRPLPAGSSPNGAELHPLIGFSADCG
jgi:hypothetical protein